MNTPLFNILAFTVAIDFLLGTLKALKQSYIAKKWVWNSDTGINGIIRNGGLLLVAFGMKYIFEKLTTESQLQVISYNTLVIGAITNTIKSWFENLKALGYNTEGEQIEEEDIKTEGE